MVLLYRELDKTLDQLKYHCYDFDFFEIFKIHFGHMADAAGLLVVHLEIKLHWVGGER